MKIEKGKRDRLTIEMAEQIVDTWKFNQDKTINELSQLMGVSYITFKNIIERHKKGEPLTPMMVLTNKSRDLIRQYYGVVTLEFLAKLLGVNYKVIYRWAERAKLEKKERSIVSVEIEWEGQKYLYIPYERPKSEKVKSKKKEKKKREPKVYLKSPMNRKKVKKDEPAKRNSLTNYNKQKEKNIAKEKREINKVRTIQCFEDAIREKVPVKIGNMTVYCHPDKIKETIEKHEQRKRMAYEKF